MYSELLSLFLSASFSVLAYVVYWLVFERIGKLWRHVLRGPEPASRPYSERLTELTASLSKASAEVDSVLAELARVAKERTSAVEKLESGLTALESRERELKNRIDTLQKTPIAVAEHFAKLLEPGERRSARRDFLLFGAGVAASTVVTIIIEFVKK